MLIGRLGLESASIPQTDRHGVLWLGRGNLTVQQGTLHLLTAGWDDLPAGDYTIPFQMLSCIVMGPGTTVSHDVLRILASHGTGLVATGDGGVRLYASMPFGPDASARARKQAMAWSDVNGARLHVARRMYAWRLGEVFPHSQIEVLRGLEGARAKEMYKRIAEQYGIRWHGRRYDRQNPEAADLPNQAINHAAVAVIAAAQVATAVAGAIPQLGFIHEDSGYSFCLDIADLFRDTMTLPIAFAAVREHSDKETLERCVRRLAGRTFRKQQLVASMIDRIKELFDADDRRSDD